MEDTLTKEFGTETLRDSQTVPRFIKVIGGGEVNGITFFIGETKSVNYIKPNLIKATATCKERTGRKTR